MREEEGIEEIYPAWEFDTKDLIFFPFFWSMFPEMCHVVRYFLTKASAIMTNMEL